MAISFQESGDSQLLLSGPDFEPSSSQKSTLTAASSLPDDGRECLTSETSGQLTFWNGEEESMFFQEGFPASHLVVPGGDAARRMTETSGRQCGMLSSKSGLFGLFVKTCLESSAWANSSEYVYVWKSSVTKHKRLLFQLTPLEQSTADNGSSLWRTPDANDSWRPPLKDLDGMTHKNKRWPNHCLSTQAAYEHLHPKLWPTPNAGNFNDGENLENWEARRHKNKEKGINGNGQGTPLAIAAKLWPTPTERDWKSCSHGNQDNARPLSEVAGLTGQGSLSPSFVEWLMGFPVGWTELQCQTRSRKTESSIDHTA